MPFSPDPASRCVTDAPVSDATTVIDLPVRGTVPLGLSGRYVHVGDGMVDAVSFVEGRVPSYRHRSFHSDAHNVISFGSSTLVFGEGALARELDADLDTIRRVDLAGAGRTLTAHPEIDPITGELHLLTFPVDGSQLHISVSRGGLTRTIRSIDNGPSPVRQLALTRDHVVLLADGFVGVTGRAGVNAKASWFAVDTDSRHMATADAHGETIIVHVAGPSLMRWTLHRQATSARCDVLDATPQRFASCSSRPSDATHRFLWTVGSGAVHKHDLLAGTRRSHGFGDGRRPGEHVFVADPSRRLTEDRGWLVGFVNDETSQETKVVVLDARAIEEPALAVARTARRIPDGGHCAWIPNVQI